MSEQQPTIVEQAQDAAAKLASTVQESLNLGGSSSTEKSGEPEAIFVPDADVPGLPNLYIDEKAGSDSTGTGAELAPFATPLAAYQSLNAPASSDSNPFAIATFLVRKPDSVERNEWVELGKSAQKKLVKGIEIYRKKELKQAQDGDKLAKAQKEQEERDVKRREEAKSVVLVDDASKEAKKVCPYRLEVKEIVEADVQTKIHELPQLIGQRVKVQAWVHRYRPQAKHYFIVLRDGTAFAQAILTGDCIRTLDAIDLTVESTVEVKGTVEKVKDGQSAPGGVELVVDWWRIIGKAPGGAESFEGRLREVSLS